MKKLGFLTERLIAHRGVQNNQYLENTLGSFKQAMIRDYVIELDIHLLKDNTVIVYHDDNLKRLTGIDRQIKDCTYDEIKEIKNIHIPSLKEVLNLVQGKVPILIEYKYDTQVGHLEKESTKLLDNYKGDFAVQSFNPLTVLWFKLNRPNYVRGQLVSNIFPNNFLINYVLRRMFTNVITSPDYIGVNLEMLNDENIQKLRSKYLILGYVIHSKKEILLYKDKADNFICNIEKELFKLLDR